MSRQLHRSLGNLVLALALGTAAMWAGIASGQWQAYPDAPLPGGRPTLPSQLKKVPPPISPEYNEPDFVQPFTDPLTFNSDFQLFSPTDLSNYGGPPPSNIGWYFTYARLYASITRGEQTKLGGDPFARPFDGGWVWGNIYDFGYMTREDHGWNATYAHISTGLLFEDEDLKIRLKPTYHSFEISKSFRQKLRWGGDLEPYFGVRYIYYADNTTDSSPSGPILVDGNGDPIPDENGQPQVAGQEEFSQKMQNQLLGGQLGCRYHIRKGRWNLSSDFRLMAAQNWQYAQVRDVDTLLGVFEVNASYNEFCPLGELRCECAYEVTRDISVRFGCSFLHIARGILRADMAPMEGNLNNPNLNGLSPDLALTNDQSMSIAGFMLGLEYNR